MTRSTTWQKWWAARRLVRLADYRAWRVATWGEHRRARRLYRRALGLLGVSEPRRTTLNARDQARLARRSTELDQAPPLLDARAHLAQHRSHGAWVAAAALTAALLAVGWSFRVELGLSPNLAGGRVWRASSAYGGSAAVGTIGPNLGRPFFHTELESSPWIQIDLGSPRTFSRARVHNRHDCCASRALPLLIEASDDRVHWRVLAVREVPFQTLDVGFNRVESRYVRLRAARETLLHLEAIGVYR